MTIYENIKALTSYALSNGLITKDDIIYTQNKLLELFHLDGFETPQAGELPCIKTGELENILAQMLDYAAANGIFEDTGIVSRDLFDTKIMGLLVPPPSTVISKFRSIYDEDGAKAATDWYYKFSCDTDYIRRYRVCKDLKWKTGTEYGELDITINLSKPEKDPKAIAAARNAKQSSYPACLLCRENEGYAGRMNHAARQNHRIIPLSLAGEQWYLQYSPYVYYNEHCIVFDAKHEPMKIERQTFKRLLDFVTLFPHYTLGSNADIPIVGGSILTHNHFQGGRYTFPMEKAPVEKDINLVGTSDGSVYFPHVQAGIVKWPMSVIRLDSPSVDELIEAADYILKKWRAYTDEEAFIFAKTDDGEVHNTITPIARRRGDLYELDLVLRNNITTEEHPLGVFHPHANLHHIKKENIGLIEVMGLAVLPSRLKKELADLGEAMCRGADLRADEVLSKHADWAEEVLARHPDFCKENADAILKEETGIVFSKVLEDAGVYKRDEAGRAAFDRFIESL
ncbi:MAG: UDP-glucose--hexose-1-phosphate uridylyltransferase [Treponema sp.]|nr:UDP-glucose--hexose-1-phosphate uridylyltransferase [Treponema sp.]